MTAKLGTNTLVHGKSWNDDSDAVAVIKRFTVLRTHFAAGNDPDADHTVAEWETICKQVGIYLTTCDPTAFFADHTADADDDRTGTFNWSDELIVALGGTAPA